MTILPVPSLNALLSKVGMGVSPTVLGKQDSRLRNQHDSHSSVFKQDLTTSKPFNYKPIAYCQQHTLHYVLKAIGYLPDSALESCVSYLNGPTTKQYEHANAHLRLILAVNNKLKRPLQLEQLGKLRQKFAIDAVAMQTPKVWQQTSTPYKSIDWLLTSKKKANAVCWQDNMIADADGGDMSIRCYQPKMGYKKHQRNSDETVMLFFHGGGFCIGDINTHHEFCHAVCAQTGWAVVSVDYRLAPEHPAPTALRDCIAAYAWLAEHCHIFGALSSRIVLAGDSAGGCLSALVAQQVASPAEKAWLDLGIEGHRTFDLLQNLPQPLAQIPIYPVTDAEIEYPSWGLYGQGLLLDHDDIVVFEAAYMQNSALTHQHVLIIPMLGDNTHVCPSYIVAAELDVLHDEAIAYAEHLQHYGIDVHIHNVLGAPHGFVHFMSVHQGLERETLMIINGFANFVRHILRPVAQLAA